MPWGIDPGAGSARATCVMQSARTRPVSAAILARVPGIGNRNQTSGQWLPLVAQTFNVLPFRKMQYPSNRRRCRAYAVGSGLALPTTPNNMTDCLGSAAPDCEERARGRGLGSVSQSAGQMIVELDSTSMASSALRG